MDGFSDQLNELLVDTFRLLLKIEEKSLKQNGKINLSISEMHLIESVGKNNGKGHTISEIAQDLGITLSSVTIAINKLEKKMYVRKYKSEDDGRCVHVLLTDAGRRIFRIHGFFHRQMVNRITGELNQQEKNIIFAGISRLNEYFKNSLAAAEG